MSANFFFSRKCCLCAVHQSVKKPAKMQRCKGNKKTKPNKQTHNLNQTKQNQTAEKHHTEKPLQQVKSSETHAEQVKQAWRLSQASHTAPRARMAGELSTRKLSCLIGQIQSATKANQTKQSKTNHKTKQTKNHKSNQPISEVKRK